MKRTIWMILALILMFFIVIFYGLPFHIATSQTNSDSQLASATSPADQEIAQPVQFDIWLEVQGRGTFSSYVQAALQDELEQSPYFRLQRAEMFGANQAQFPRLVVAVAAPDMFWTPVVANAEAEAEFAFATYETEISPGMSQFTSYSGAGDGPNLISGGKAHLTDQTRGLVSRPGYQKMLAQKLAHEIVNQLNNRIKDL